MGSSAPAGPPLRRVAGGCTHGARGQEPLQEPRATFLPAGKPGACHCRLHPTAAGCTRTVIPAGTRLCHEIVPSSNLGAPSVKGETPTVAPAAPHFTVHPNGVCSGRTDRWMEDHHPAGSPSPTEGSKQDQGAWLGALGERPPIPSPPHTCPIPGATGQLWVPLPGANCRQLICN